MSYHGSSKETIGIVIVFTLGGDKKRSLNITIIIFLLKSISKCNSFCSKATKYVVYNFEQNCHHFYIRFFSKALPKRLILMYYVLHFFIFLKKLSFQVKYIHIVRTKREQVTQQG